VLGLGKKVLIADRIAPGADLLFAHPSMHGLAMTWTGVLCYAMQLYFDFSGYSDMALGLARMFSIRFPINFDSPYKAHSIIEFWQRWHMTLSRYIGEYLYTPILRQVNGRRMDAGKKVSRKAQATLEGFVQIVFFPTMTAMFIAGIWHGAGPQYLVFGLLHGSYLVINHAWRLLTPKGHEWHGRLPVAVSIALTFLAVLVSEVFFRAKDVHEALYLVGTMVGAHGMGPRGVPVPTKSLITLVLCIPMVWAMPNTQEILGQLEKGAVPWFSLLPGLRWRPTLAWSLALTVVLCLAITELDSTASFLYFQF
jgi:D-alanyl-lipoteichoic acid acyltransferase DltB (MBOAT superfamily)